MIVFMIMIMKFIYVIHVWKIANPILFDDIFEFKKKVFGIFYFQKYS